MIGNFFPWQELNTLQQERTMLKEQIIAQQKVVDDSKPDEGQLAEKEAALEGLLRDFEAAKEVSSELKEEVKKLNKKIKDVQNSRVLKSSKKNLKSSQILFSRLPLMTETAIRWQPSKSYAVKIT